MTSRVTLTSAIAAVEIAERIIAGGTPIPRNAAQREKLQADLKGAVEYLVRNVVDRILPLDEQQMAYERDRRDAKP